MHGISSSVSEFASIDKKNAIDDITLNLSNAFDCLLDLDTSGTTPTQTKWSDESEK